MQQLKLDGMDSLLTTTEQAKILGILKIMRLIQKHQGQVI